MNYLKLSLLVICICGLSLSQASATTIKVNSIIEDTLPVTHSTKIQIIKFGLFQPDTLEETTILEFGDELSSYYDNIVINLKSVTDQGDESEFYFTSPFRFVLVPSSSGHGCGISLLGGTVDVLTESETEIRTGEVTLGSERTIYRMEINRSNQEIKTEAYVFEGDIKVKIPGARQMPLVAGRKISLVSGRVLDPADLQDADIHQAANTYALVDVSKMGLTGHEKNAALNRFTDIHMNVLKSPNESQPRVELAVARLNADIKTESTSIYLEQAKKKVATDDEQKANIMFVKGLTLYHMGNEKAAEKEFDRAQRIDPGISKEKISQFYNINPIILDHVIIKETPTPGAPRDLRPD